MTKATHVLMEVHAIMCHQCHQDSIHAVVHLATRDKIVKMVRNYFLLAMGTVPREGAWYPVVTREGDCEGQV